MWLMKRVLSEWLEKSDKGVKLKAQRLVGSTPDFHPPFSKMPFCRLRG